MTADGPSQNVFSPDGARVIAALRVEEDAEPEYELLSAGLVWPDEFSRDLDFDDHAQLRCLWAYRAALIRGHDGSKHRYRYLWRDMERHFPEWPALRPERRVSTLAPLLRKLHAEARQEIDRLSDRLKPPSGIHAPTHLKTPGPTSASNDAKSSGDS